VTNHGNLYLWENAFFIALRKLFLPTGWHSYPSKGGLARDFLEKLICNFATCQWSDRFGDELYRTEET